MNRSFLALLAAIVPGPIAAQDAPSPPPKLVIVISVDQFSGDLFGQYRRQFTDGFARLMEGAVFPSGYQSHAATETCPGHSTITTGARPGRTGIIANEWIDLRSTRPDKTVYCSEDATVPGSSSTNFTVSDKNLLVPTLGERMKATNPASRVVSVAGKDRSAVMMGGHKVDELWWWDGKTYRSYADRAIPPAVAAAKAAVAARLEQAQPALSVPPHCSARDRPIDIGGGKTVGTKHFARAAGDALAFRASPEFDSATLALAAALIRDMELGTGPATDIITIGASATDYVGHTYGAGGVEMCVHMQALDRALGDLLRAVDAMGVDYVVAMTADHGGLDLPERTSQNAAPGGRADPALNAKTIGTAIAARLGLKGQLLWGSNLGEMWIDPTLSKKQRAKVLAESVRAFRAHPQVQAVFTAAELAATPSPSGPPDSWTLLQRARASYNAERSGDFVVVLKPRITPLVEAGKPFVASHGSFWDYDRRVPILFWRKGMTGFEQPLSVETVDIAPTLAALIGLPLKPGDMDGRCLDLQVGAGSTCGAAGDQQ